MSSPDFLPLVYPKNPPKQIYFIGIAGSGMAPLAELAAQRGFIISGSDTGKSLKISQLKSSGINVFSNHQPSNLEGIDTVVYSSAIKDDNPELLLAKKNQLNVLHRSDFLNFLMTNHQTVVIAGTHGKTTTSAIITHMLSKLRLEPSAVIGAALNSSKSASLVGKKDGLFVCEADESDGSFLKYSPLIGMITNIGLDHLDFYQNQEQIEAAFLEFANHISQDGQLIIGWDSPLARSLGEKIDRPLLSYGFVLGCDIRCLSYAATSQGMSFRCVIEKDIVDCNIPMLGKVNIMNALAALGVARALKLDVNDAAKSLASFPGVERRLNVLHRSNNLILINDYAHNPDKIAACIEAIKTAYPNFKLTVLFEPHRYSRVTALYEDFISCFEQADEVVNLPVFAAGEAKPKSFNPSQFSADICAAHPQKIICKEFSTFDQSFSYIIKEIKPKTAVLIVSAGNIAEFASRLQEGFSEWEKDQSKNL